MRQRRRQRRAGGERWPSGDRLEQHDAGGVQVGRRGHRTAADLLGREVLRRADELAGEREISFADALGDAEVGELGGPVSGDEDVARLDVAVDDAGAMSGAERLQHVVDDADGVVDGQRPLRRQAIRQRASVHQLHDEVEVAIGVAGVEHRDGVGVGERRRCTRLADEPPAHSRVGGGPRVDELDGDRPVQTQVAGGAHLGHAATAQRPAELVAPGDHVVHRRDARSRFSATGRGTLPS